MLKVSGRIQVRNQAVTSEHAIITVENLRTAITKKLHTNSPRHKSSHTKKSPHGKKRDTASSSPDDRPMKSPMKWWLRAILASIVLTVFCIGGAFYLTEIALKGQKTPEKDRVISETVGQVLGFGLPGVWLLCFVFRKKDQPPG